MEWKENLETDRHAKWFFYINAKTRFLRTYPALVQNPHISENTIVSPRNAAVEQVSDDLEKLSAKFISSVLYY